ncbi:MAG: YlxR family protein [Chloroflexi bacterium]|nr:YlxR family protein [Chloroflexota bacterium]
MARARHIPERKCVACGQRVPKRLLTRIVRTPQGEVQADSTGKTSGRGAYLCHSPDCWERGLRKGGLEKSLRLKIASQDLDSLMDFYRAQVVSPSLRED